MSCRTRPGPGNDLDQPREHVDVQQRGLVEEHEVGGERERFDSSGVAVSDEPVDRAGLCVCDALEVAGGAAGRRARCDRQPGCVCRGRDGGDHVRLAGAGLPDDDADPVLPGGRDRGLLVFEQTIGKCDRCGPSSAGLRETAQVRRHPRLDVVSLRAPHEPAAPDDAAGARGDRELIDVEDAAEQLRGVGE